nr:histidine phosphatase family protein [Cognatishimia sp. F0-27]
MIRHGQARFGTEDYDRLSDLGFEQARALGRALKRRGMAAPTTFARGTLRRQRETLEALCDGFEVAPETVQVLPGLDEFDFGALLAARFASEPAPEGLNSDRKLHFRVLRDTVLGWQRDEIAQPPEPFSGFAARVRAAAETLRGARDAIAVSSAGPIALMVAQALDAPDSQMIRLQLQMRNTAVTRLRAGRAALFLDGFNETPHIAGETDPLLTYS